MAAIDKWVQDMNSEDEEDTNDEEDNDDEESDHEDYRSHPMFQSFDRDQKHGDFDVMGKVALIYCYFHELFIFV